MRQYLGILGYLEIFGDMRCKIVRFVRFVKNLVVMSAINYTFGDLQNWAIYEKKFDPDLHKW